MLTRELQMVLTNLGVAVGIKWRAVWKKAEQLELHKEKEKAKFLIAWKCGSTLLVQRLITKVSS